MIKRIIRLLMPFALIFLAFSVFTSIGVGHLLSDRADAELVDASVQKEDDIFSLMVVGKDRVSSLADVIMLVSFNRTDDTICVLQIPRDTYADYGNDNYYKVNGALRTLGADGMCDFFERSFGIHLNGYISLDLEGFRNAVDAVGGVEVTIEKDLKYNDPSQGLYINLSKGRQVLDGKKAEMLVRYRSGYARGDLDRLDTQKRFLMEMFLGLKREVNLLNAYELANTVLPYIETDVNASELISVALSGIFVDDEDICFATLPGEAAVSDISGGSFFVMSKPSSKELVSRYFLTTDTEFDRNGAFLHTGLKKFKEIYCSDAENDPFFIKDLK